MMFIEGASYPLHLLADAETLAEAAKQRRTGGQTTTTPEERAFARAAIFTAFNFVESLLIELTQSSLSDPTTSQRAKRAIEKRLKNGTANISKTIKKWPKKLGKAPVHHRSEFRSFKELRQLRNNLTHPKLQPLASHDPTQDALLLAVNATKAKWALDEVKKMGRALYTSYGGPIPPELQIGKQSGRKKKR
jgi:hypothetical protein